MRITLFAIIVLCTIWDINGQSSPIIVSSKPSNEIIEVEEAPVNKFDLNYSTLPGQPMISGSMRNAFGKSKVSYSDIDGSPYLNPEPVKGIVTLLNGEQYTDVLLQVDLYSNDIIASGDDGKEIALDKALYTSFMIPHEGKDLVFEKVNKEKPGDFYIVLFDDTDYTLFKSKYVSFKEGVNKGITKTPAEFIELNDYYITTRNKKSALKIKLKKKDILANLPRQEAKVLSKYLDQNKVKLKKEDDFVKALQFVSEQIEATNQ